MGFTHILSEVISFIFPPTEDERLVATVDETLIDTLTIVPLPGGVRALLPYRDPRVRALIHRTKYARDPRAISLLAHALHTHLTTRATPHLVIPIPLSKERAQERSYNQTELIVREAVRGTHHTLNTSLLIRRRHTPPQTHLTRKERLTNLVGAFDTAPAINTEIRSLPILLIDDVTTTGATLAEAQKAFEGAGIASIDILALAH